MKIITLHYIKLHSIIGTFALTLTMLLKFINRTKYISLHTHMHYNTPQNISACNTFITSLYKQCVAIQINTCIRTSTGVRFSKQNIRIHSYITLHNGTTVDSNKDNKIMIIHCARIMQTHLYTFNYCKLALFFLHKQNYARRKENYRWTTRTRNITKKNT